MRNRLFKGLALAAAVVGAAALATPAGAATATGPNTLTPPYVLPVAPGTDVTSLLTVADAGAAGNGFEMVGIPDGLGARRVGDKVEVFNNQELRNTQGVVRAHGQPGAFVTRYTVDPRTNGVTAGADLIQPGVRFYDYLTDTYTAAPNGAGTNPTTGKSFPAYNAAFSRFCSGSLTDPLQLLSLRSGKGFAGQIYFANEENGNEGRLFGVTTEGQAQQLPRLGLLSWENTLLARTTSDATVAIGDEDGGDGQLWVYSGTKQLTGNAFDKAGLTNGGHSVVRVGGGALGDPAVRGQIAAAPGHKVAFDLADIAWNQSGAEQNAEALAKGLSLTRIEDGNWDPLDRNVYYFVTTEGGVGATPARDGGGLWRLTFKDVDNPKAGGTLELLLDGSEAIGLNKPDNITVDADGGHILIQEDAGNSPHVGRIVAYRIADGKTAVVARFDPSLFDPTVAGANLITQDEESSGIIDVSRWYLALPRSAAEAFPFVRDLLTGIRGGTFLFDAQVHTATGLDNPAAQVERGQLMVLRIADWAKVYGP